MIKDITIGQYFPGESIVHKLDPRIKILIITLFMVAVFMIKTFPPYLFIVFFILFTVYISKVPVKFIIKGLKPLRFIMLITFTINIFLTDGVVLFNIGPLTVTEEGLKFASFMILRLIFLVVGTSLLTLTTSPIALTDGIESLLKPLNIINFPTHEFAMMMTIALRFIPTLLEETDKIMKAQQARGADFESGNIINRAKSLVPLLIPLFLNSFRRADELATAMEARCYHGGDNRTSLNELELVKMDIIIFIICLIYFGIVIYFRSI